MCKYFLFKDHVERSESGWLSTHTRECRCSGAVVALATHTHAVLSFLPAPRIYSQCDIFPCGPAGMFLKKGNCNGSA